MPDLYFENLSTGKRFKVVDIDREAGVITMTGQHEVPFTTDYSKELFERLGYVPKMVESAPPPPVTA